MRRDTRIRRDRPRLIEARSTWLAGALVAAIAASGSTTASGRAAAAGRTGKPSSAATDYRLHCAGCHGAGGQGGTGDDLRGLSDTPEAIAAVIANGQGKMPPFRRKLSAGQRRRLAVYVKGFK